MFLVEPDKLDILISSLSNETRDSAGMARLAKPVPRVSGRAEKIYIKRHLRSFYLSYIISRFIGEKTAKQKNQSAEGAGGLGIIRGNKV